MKRLYFLCIVLLFCSSHIYKPPNSSNYRDDIVKLSVYEVAELATGAPSRILKALAIVESNENDKARGDGGKSRGRMQINEKWRAERVKKYGKYNPHNAQDAVVLTGRIFMDNLKYFKGDIDKAIAAHKMGRDGVTSIGMPGKYVNKVKSLLQ